MEEYGHNTYNTSCNNICKNCKYKLGKVNHLRCGNKNSNMFDKPVTNNYGCGLIKH
jgi:hypothetical protein